MTDTIANRPIWRLLFDKDGDPDPQTLTELKEGIAANQYTDLVIFSHGWNNDEKTAKSLYDRWFALLADQIDPTIKAGFVGIRWPSQLWRDEPIPDFAAPSQPTPGGTAALAKQSTVAAGPPTIDPLQLEELKKIFPDGAAQLDTIAALLTQVPSQDRVNALFNAMREFSSATATGFNDGEEAKKSDQPGMLRADQNPNLVFGKFYDKLVESGVDFSSGGGTAGLTDLAKKLLYGAKETLRQLTYWQMKNRAGVVGKDGLGPVITQLAGQFDGLRIHLIGHSFGARLVSFALAGLPTSGPSPVRAVTLLQGAYSRFAFSDSLPFLTALEKPRAGALAGRLNRINGPMTVCFSKHDRALGIFYPLASMSVGDDAAALWDPLGRWRAMGSDGAFGAAPQPLKGTGSEYPFETGKILNLDASDVVTQGNSPSGAHSDIFYPQLAWVAAAAGGLNPK
ncbi:alpha/beta fold hydrolase [Mycobacterium sp. E2479]|uniref:alpha/beta fold hydrolase n=1 Tax=Mycobacterium sp. E2479 TaxID=1834134 RepID=UPI0007FD3CD0|nr:serine-threonine protein kinase [Mycobacterium sp. E2479]OBH60281.1 serine-threonine protein kinase [Mycobacterium sp. E2479]